MIRFHVGIDVGKHRHCACVHDLGTGTYSKAFSFTVDRCGFDRFLTFLKRYGQAPEFLLGIEATGPYGLTIAHFMLARGHAVVELNPFQANQFRKAQGRKAKTDRIDCRSLADFLAVGSAKPLSFQNPLRENLRELTRFRADLVKERTIQINRLHGALVLAFPELDSHLSSLDSPTALALISAYPGPQIMIEAGILGIEKTLREASHGRLGLAQATAIVEAASVTVGLLHRQAALSIKLEILSAAISASNQQIRKVETAIEGIFHELDYDRLNFPVGTFQSQAGILAEIEDVHRFPTLKQFLSHFGWCPKNYQSGGFCLEHPRMSHAGNPYVRRLIWMLSIIAIKTVPAYREYFRHRVEAGKKKMHTIVAVGRKLLSVIYAILKTGKPYSPREEFSTLAFAGH